MKLADIEPLIGQDVAVVDYENDGSPAKAKVIGITKVNKGSESFPKMVRKVEVEVTATRLRLDSNEEFEIDPERIYGARYKLPGRHVIDGRGIAYTWETAREIAARRLAARRAANALHDRAANAAERIRLVIEGPEDGRPRIEARGGTVRISLTVEEAEALATTLGAPELEPYA